MNYAKKCSIVAMLIIFSVLFFGTVHALSYTVAQHTINIQISTDTNTQKDSVVEKFYVNFSSEADKIDFRQNSTQLGTSVDAWKRLNPLFVPSLGDNTQNKKIAYTEGEQNYLQISYDLTEPLMVKGKDATMLTEYDLKVNFFNSFYQAGLWIIPENTTISIEIPPGAEIRDVVEPTASINNNGTRKVVSWQGYLSANKLALSYVVWKKMPPVIDLSATTNFLFKTQEGLLLLLIVAIIIIAIAWQRKKLGRGIEEFVEKHSLIKEE